MYMGTSHCEIGQGSQIRDAETSVEFLCQKFEALSAQLRDEEQRRCFVRPISVLIFWIHRV